MRISSRVNGRECRVQSMECRPGGGDDGSGDREEKNSHSVQRQSQEMADRAREGDLLVCLSDNDIRAGEKDLGAADLD